MLAWTFVRTFVPRAAMWMGTGIATAALAMGCAVQGESSGGFGSSGTGSSSGGGSGSSSSGSAQPILVEVDPNRTMNASPGEGVGVFVEYATGGHWHVWWTCDTNKTGEGCAFNNTVTVASGAITNLAGQTPQTGDTLTQPSAEQIVAVTNTTTGTDGMTFDTPFSSGQTPVITLDAKLNGTENGFDSGQYVFFVQDGQINGGYQGTLTNPLMLEPQTP